MQALMFYIIAILISSYETKKEKQEQASTAVMHDTAKQHLSNYNNLPLRH